MTSLDQDYFEKIYAAGDDPWGFETAWYERRKQALTMALLPKDRYQRVFEPGCASGELTKMVSARADQVVALEMMPRIAARATQRLSDLPNVEVRTGAIPDGWPDLRFDLVLLSEVVYYLDLSDLARLAKLIDQTLLPGGDVVAVHYLGETDYPLKGSQVNCLLQEHLGYKTFATYVEHDFSAMVLQR